MVVEEGPGVEHADAGLLDLGGDGAEDGLGVAFLERRHERDQLQVGHHAGEELAGRDLAGHHGAGGFQVAQGVEHLPELAHGDRTVVGVGESRDQRRIGLFFERHQPDLGSAGAGAFDEQGRVATFAGDDDDRARRIQAGGKESRGSRHAALFPAPAPGSSLLWVAIG